MYGLYVGRFVGGVAVGAFSVSIPPYIEDIAEKELLPSLASFYHMHFACGVLFGYIIGKFLESLLIQYLVRIICFIYLCISAFVLTD